MISDSHSIKSPKETSFALAVLFKAKSAVALPPPLLPSKLAYKKWQLSEL